MVRLTGVAKILSFEPYDEVLVKIWAGTPIVDLLEQLDKAARLAGFKISKGYDVAAHYSQDLREGEYATKQPIAGGPIAAAFFFDVTHVPFPASRTHCATVSCFQRCRHGQLQQQQ